MRKKDTFTVITPIPSFIPRQLAIDILHAHSEVITLNPLVIDHKPIPAPRNAETDEYYSTWYEISERLQVVPGLGKMGSSIIKFNGCFHDMPWGLQTHIYAPMNVNLRNTYRIGGNQPGFEPPEIPEIGMKALGTPSDGLYLREDIEIKCNITVMSFVKSQTKKAGGEMVRRIIKKAELLDAGVLQAMIKDGKLKTINPADRSNSTSLHYLLSIKGSQPIGSPRLGSTPTPYQVPRVQSMYSGYQRPSTARSQGGGYNPYPAAPGHGVPDAPQELLASEPGLPSFAPIEMPGDFYHASPNIQPDSLREHVQRAALVSLFPKLLLQRPWTRERLDIEFSDTLSDFAEALKRLYKLQQRTSYWKDMYDRLYDEYENLGDEYQRAIADNSYMSVKIKRMDDMITDLHTKIQGLQAEVAGQGLTMIAQQGERELPSPPSPYLSQWIDSHWIDSRSEPVNGEEEKNLDSLSLAIM